MGKVSKIKLHKKRNDRYHIYFQKEGKDEYGFTVNEDVLVKHGIQKGVTLTSDQIAAISKDEEKSKAFSRALHFLSFRMRTVKEIDDYLREQEIEDDQAEEILERLINMNLLDDKAFAESYVRTKKNTQKKGPLKIRMELREKGVANVHIDSALEQFSQEEQYGMAFELAEKKQRSYRNQSIQQIKQKLVQFLVQKGFPSGLAAEVVKELDFSSEQEEAELEALGKQGEKAARKYDRYEGWEQERRIRQYLYGRGFPFEKIDRWLEEWKQEQMGED
ncbi:recombination regulator RecX [Alteribacter natronophilus]|uniref:recombination regulator RecX n=1 Tax=Alteribacter natronophilus TaxID=2583810 RepID=UPI00110D9C48|nr:recombination regulator RecX [Alteribacter natronophilus]TMW70585.1 recombination regulator RecX [Alteribacter natronophilus]